eukprot:CAMPEP_0173352670 /NCGR_PEP_ID=MMETSP1144-20121109/16151_1 /TAXON_ID=483371 /ORGANISM="non described non described, Strain CCMP2298" /LENGTH=106 /DNA_ID=CAMNT_0014300919 /DNA_START=290 /DNA_END=610 /DNA_ORIENTATION=-
MILAVLRNLDSGIVSGLLEVRRAIRLSPQRLHSTPAGRLVGGGQLWTPDHDLDRRRLQVFLSTYDWRAQSPQEGQVPGDPNQTAFPRGQIRVNMTTRSSMVRTAAR